MSEKKSAVENLDDYFAANAAWCNPVKRKRIAIAVFDLLRLVSHAADMHGADPAAARVSTLELLAWLSELAWEKISMNVAPTFDAAVAMTAPSQRDLNTVYDGLKAFVSVLEAEPESATGDVLQACLTPPDQAIWPDDPPPPANLAPDLVRAGNLGDVFEPGRLPPPETLPLLNWQSTLAGGALGPQLSAIRLKIAENNGITFLTETGEIIREPGNSFLLAALDVGDYDNVPPYLLACARTLAAEYEIGNDDAQRDEWFGRFTKPLYVQAMPRAFIAPLETLFVDDMPGTTPGYGVTVTVAIDDTPYSATLEARVGASGPYVTAKLVDAAGNVVMRLDTPRRFDPAGVYLFPLQDSVIALVFTP